MQVTPSSVSANGQEVGSQAEHQTRPASGLGVVSPAQVSPSAISVRLQLGVLYPMRRRGPARS